MRIAPARHIAAGGLQRNVAVAGNETTRSMLAGTLLAYFGADVIKIEPPGKGDAVRGWRAVEGDTSLWWYSLGRNKRSVAVNLKSDEGLSIIRRLAANVRVVRPVCGPRHQLPVHVHRLDEGEVVEVGATMEGVVDRVLHARAGVEPAEAGGYRLGHRPEVYRDVLGLREHLA